MTKPIRKSVGISIGETTINASINGENSGYLILAKTLTQQFTHLSKNHAGNTICFCEGIVKLGIRLCNIYKVDQLGDIFTIGLTRFTFEYLCNKFMG